MATSYKINDQDIVVDRNSITIEGQLEIKGVWPFQRLFIEDQDIGGLLNDLYFQMSSSGDYQGRALVDISNTQQRGKITITIQPDAG